MIDLFKDILKLRSLLTRRDTWKLVFLFGLMVLGSIFDAMGIGAISVFVTLATKPSVLAESHWLSQWLSDLPNEPTVTLMLWASIALLGFIVFKNVFLIVVFYVQARIVTSLHIKLGDRMFRTYQSAPYEWYLQRSSSELLRNIQQDIAHIISGILTPFLGLIMSVLMIGFIVIVMVLNLPSIALLGLLVTGGGLFVVIRVFQAHFRSMGELTRRELEQIIKAIQQGFGAFVDARIIGCEHILRKTHRDSLVRMAKVNRKRTTIHKSTPYMLETLTILGLLIVLLLLIQSTNSPNTVLSIMALLVVAMLRLKQLTGQIAYLINFMNAERAFIPGILHDLHELSALEATRRAKISDEQSIDSFHRLHLVNVTYTYPNTETSAVQDVSLELRRGESIAFVGTTGCGKSTLINLILGLLEPQTGQVTVNGVDISQDIKGWRKQLGYIPQSIYLLDDTIRANVAFGIPSAEVNEDQLWNALRSACLEEFIVAQPDGLDALVGERGVRLSGGQRQRLGIARALYFNPEVLVMDEATSALDNITEEKVMQAIQHLKQNRTLIMIAHRLSTIEGCDRLYFMRKRKIHAVGTFEELSQSSADFQEMARMQTTSS